MTQFNRRNDPNPARLIESLRHVGYGNYEAIADLVDNAFDAEANRIVINVSKHRDDFRITVADDGIGMSRETLDQALRLGSLTERDITTDLGKFGMGLVTASLSMCRRTEVITKHAPDYETSVVDVDEVVRSNEFCKHLAPSTDDEKAFFNDILGDVESGTVVCLSKTDAMSNRNTTQFANTLRKHLAEVHRCFLMAGKTIAVNDEAIEAIDPLMWDDPRTEVFSDDVYPIEIENNGETTAENIRVRITLIPQDFAAGDLALAKSLHYQGFYVMRNNRQIYRAQTLGFFTKHNDFNRMRGEIYFTGRLDDLVGIEFTKRQVVFDQAIQDKLGQHLVGQCRTIKRREAGKNVESGTSAQDELHSQASKAITEKSRLLITPKAIIEKRGPKTQSRQARSTPGPATGRERSNFRDTQRTDSAPRCKFVCQRLGPNGQIYECDLEGRTVIIRWNIEHPFYRRFVADNQNDGKLVTAADFLVYSMACSELRARDDDNVEFINNMKAVISANLRTLLN